MKPKSYNISPAKGQALLSYDGRLMPRDNITMTLYETEEIESVVTRGSKLLKVDTELNSDFTNLMLQGDCLSACAYLKANNITVDLVYIDPPFASGANYAKNIYLRNGGETDIADDDNSIGEEVMYGDIWQKEDYLNWLYERLLAIREVMSDTASIYVHLDWHIGHYVKVLMDEVFGEENFVNEIIWCYKGMGNKNSPRFQARHDILFLYSKQEKTIFNQQLGQPTPETLKTYKSAEKIGYLVNKKRMMAVIFDHDKYQKAIADGKLPKGMKEKEFDGGRPVIADWWADIKIVGGPENQEREDYNTQKPETLLERIIKASSNEGMIVADFFSGSGTTAKVANDLNRKFIACDIGINAVQTTRDRLVKSGASFNVLKIKDGLRLFRNPAQTEARIFSIIDGYQTATELQLGEFWDGGIAQPNGTYAPIKFTGIHQILDRQLLDFYLEQVYNLGETDDSEVWIIYAHKESALNQQYLNDVVQDIARTEAKIRLVSLNELLDEKKDALFLPDNAVVEVKKQDTQWQVEIVQFHSSYLRAKLNDYNAKKVKQSMHVEISDGGLELIEAVQFDTAGKKFWQSNPYLEDKADRKDKIKGIYLLDTDQFKIKIRNIAGDELVLNSTDLNRR